MRGFCRITGTLANLRQAFAEHRRILAAFEARDAKAASRAMSAHIDARLKTVLDEISDQEAYKQTRLARCAAAGHA